MPLNIGNELSGARSGLARWIDRHLRITSIAAMVAAPLAVWKAVDVVRWVL